MTTPFHRAYRAELVAAGHREIARRRRRRRLRLAIGAALAAIAGTVGALVLPDPVAADVSVDFVDGYVEVRLRGPVSSHDDVLEALREHGIDATVVGAPTGPSAVGLFTTAYVAMGSGTEQADVLGPPGSSFRGFRIREDFAGELVIGVGRAARAGEPYDAMTSAFAEGEPLDCSGVLGRRLSDVVERLHGLTVSVRSDSAGGAHVTSLEEALQGEAASRFVNGARAMSATSVELAVGPSPGPEEDGC